MKSFPDFQASCFDIAEYNKTFKTKNVIIHASAKDVSYAEHWGPLSLKCAIKGTEHYQCNNRFYSVDNDGYLIFNDGQYYSSHIYSKTETESFTVNFSIALQHEVLQSFESDLDDEPGKKGFECIEKLYRHDDITTPLIKKLYYASVAAKPDMQLISETYYSVLESLLVQQTLLKNEIKKVKAVRPSTQVELYKRLNYAKDFIHSCYMNEISLDDLASVACMNNAYFLREFKKYFGLSPHQYIIRQRLNVAKKLMQTTSLSISEICFEVGYSDVTSFGKLFKKHFSLTPAFFRLNTMKKSFFTSWFCSVKATLEEI
jgi:AraC-like DNA-binding protein